MAQKKQLSEKERWNSYHIDNNPTNPLNNLVGAKTFEELNQKERNISDISTRFIPNIKQTFDVEHYQNIHKTLFCNVYEWAGQFRDVNMMKANVAFEYYENIESRLTRVFNNLKQENYLVDLTLISFVEKAGNLLGELNDIHPFREGNGRTQRVFISDLAMKNNFYIDWRSMYKKDMILASKSSILDRDNDYLINMIKSSTYELNQYKKLLD